jgi:hypothetical protein
MVYIDSKIKGHSYVGEVWHVILDGPIHENHSKLQLRPAWSSSPLNRNLGTTK